jgi:hypothetical protein
MRVAGIAGHSNSRRTSLESMTAVDSDAIGGYLGIRTCALRQVSEKACDKAGLEFDGVNPIG